MTTRIGSYEAKTHLPELLRKVRAGESFTITNHGTPVAELVPPGQHRDAEATRAAERMEHFMRNNRIPGVDIKALIEEGRD